MAFEYEQEYSTKGRRGLMDSSVMYSAIALKAALKRRDHFEITRCFRVLESNAVSKEDYQAAVRYADSAIFHLKKIKIPMNPAALYVTKALDYADLKNHSEAQRWIDTSIYYAEKMEGKTPATAAVYGQAAQIFEKAGNLPRAIAAMKIYNHMKDSVFTQERLVKINELEQKYYKEKNENTIKDLARKKQFYLFLAIAGLLGIAAVSFFLRQQALTYKKNILEAEQRLNRARMNPHFFFNALTALQKFAVTENNPQAMATNLSRFSNIMRETLESTYKEYVSIEQEMDFLEEYLDVQSIRFPQAFSYEIKADHDLEVDELLIPSMIIQPFVENSIEHGFSGIEYQANIQVEFKKDDKSLLVLISDNGLGIRGESPENHQHISRASQILKDRIYLLNLKLKTKAGFHIDNEASGKGVIVKINLPLLYKNQSQS
ncbi:sensor histidine kinase [Haliscomenobacter sp.]|uniref:sensor histidine kinase n=1 Tax=Haliscomenobacter sp. TaxID=2717303 RepID=UPI003BAB938A